MKMGLKSKILKLFKITKTDRKIKELLNFFKYDSNEEIKEILEIIKKTRNLEMINFNGRIEFKKNIKIDCNYDHEKKLYYIFHNGKRMYMSRKYNSKEMAEEYYKTLLIEQHINSPHRYLTDNFNLKKGSCLIDCGGAEGIFTLENIDKIEKAYIFECDSDWLEALNFTFEDYKEKVQIIGKYVSDKDSQFEIKLDTFQKKIKKK